MRKGTAVFVLFVFLITCILPPSGIAQTVSTVSQLPQPGTMVKPSEAFSPALLRGMIVHPEKPLQFDFIVDTGDDNLTGSELSSESQRMINYFLASLAIPEKDLWVNLSPVEKDRIIPDALVKTELGRDLLAQDYILKQLTASLIYPEDDLGKTFWQRVYDEAFQKFGTVDVPVDVFNKVWIVPERAEVIEKGNTVYIAKAYLKVMLEADYQAQGKLGEIAPAAHDATPVDEMTKQVLREVVVPAIEQEVNEGKNFAQLRQVIYAMILAQWYEDVSKEAVLNKAYSGKNKVAGIDLSDPKNKEIIYQQYMAAYKQGVFDYIKEETDRLTNEPVPKKYFSGGILEKKVVRVPAKPDEVARLSSLPRDRAMRVSVDVRPGREFKPENRKSWSDLNRSLGIEKELKEGAWASGQFVPEKAKDIFEKYSPQIDYEVANGNPVQGAIPVLQAVAALDEDQEKELTAWDKAVPAAQRTRLMEQVLLMEKEYDTTWVKTNTPELVGLPYYFVSFEIDFKAGGLGPVNVTHSKFLQRLGANVHNIQPMYTWRFDTGKVGGEPLDYMSKDMGYQELKKTDISYSVPMDGKMVKVEVWEGVNREGVHTYLTRDIQPDGTSKYTKTLYRYNDPQYNPVSMEETMAFFNLAAAELINQLEIKRKQEQADNYTEPVVHAQDGQMGPFFATVMSHHPWLAKAFFMGTTHTVLNVGQNGIEAVDWFLKNMLGIKPKYLPAFVTDVYFDSQTGEVKRSTKQYVQYTKAMMELATGGLRTGVSWTHAVRDMSRLYGGVILKEELKAIWYGDEKAADRVLRDLRGRYIDAHDGILPEFRSLKSYKDMVLPGYPDVQKEQICAILKKADRLPVMAITNGDDSDRIASFFHKSVSLLQERKLIPDGVNVDRLLPWMVQMAKELSVERYNELKIRSAVGDDLLIEAKNRFAARYEKEKNEGTRTRGLEELWDLDEKDAIQVMGWAESWRKITFSEGAEGYREFREDFYSTIDPKALTVAYARRLVTEKNNFDPEFIKQQVALGINVIFQGNHQGGSSDKLAGDYKQIQIDIRNEQKKAKKLGQPNPYPGRFYFIQHFTEEEKIALIAALTAYEMLNKIFLGANELWEENPFASYGLMIALDHELGHGDGLTTDIVREIDFDKPGAGSLVMLRDGAKLDEWMTKIKKLKELWDKGTVFFENSVQSAKMSRIGQGQLTAAAYLWAVNDVIAQRKKERQADLLAVQDINSLIPQADKQQVQYFNRGGEFKFNGFGNPRGRGLAGFIAKAQEIETQNGYNALYDQIPNYREFLVDLFFKSPEAQAKFRAWYDAWEQMPGGMKDKNERLQEFLGDINNALAGVQTKPVTVVDKAMAPGGIDVRNIGVDRQGQLMTGVMSDQALEEMLTNAAGVHGVITGITPIPDLFTALGAAH